MIHKAGMGMQIEFSAVALPRAGLCLNEAKDKWFGAHAQNRILDFGDSKGCELLVGYDKCRTVEYKLVPELSPKGMTLEKLAVEMRKQGFDVLAISYENGTVKVREQLER